MRGLYFFVLRMKVIVLMIITVLIFTNALTDAPNAIATLVGTKVMKFKKAARLSAFFNFLGIIAMSFINFSVANCLSTVVKVQDANLGYIVITSAMISVIFFSLLALIFGIPTSETHALIAGLTGAGIAVYDVNSISLSEWKFVFIGLVWSIIGTFILSFCITRLLYNCIKNVKDEKIMKTQIICSCGMSFMHGAQDGQKFIGILIIYICLLRNVPIPYNVNPFDYIGIIIFTAFVMTVGCSFGGKRIVDNIGNDMAKLSIQEGLFSDISTIIVLLFSSLTRIAC